jgi:hypothetical protein
MINKPLFLYHATYATNRDSIIGYFDENDNPVFGPGLTVNKIGGVDDAGHNKAIYFTKYPPWYITKRRINTDVNSAKFVSDFVSTMLCDEINKEIDVYKILTYDLNIYKKNEHEYLTYEDVPFNSIVEMYEGIKCSDLEEEIQRSGIV